MRRPCAAIPARCSLPIDVWRQRQRWLLAVLWAHAVVLGAYAAATGRAPAEIALRLAPVVMAAALTGLTGLSARMQGLLVAVGLLGASSALIAFRDGQPDAWLHPFLVLVLLMLYEDWSLLLLAVLFVAAHHVVSGDGWPQAGTHTLFVGLVAAAGIVAGVLGARLRGQAREATQRFRRSFDSAPIGMAIVTLDGRLTDVNAALCEIVGCDRQTLLRCTLDELTVERDRGSDAPQIREMLAGTRRMTQGHRRFVHAGGSTIWVNLSLAFVPGGPGTAHFIAQIEDITERKLAVDRLQHLADHDALTGLVNRRRLEQELERRIALAERHRERSALILLDLDDFKTTNDTLGHAAGDELLQSIAAVLRGRVRGEDVVARLGGDEFAVLLVHASLDQARAVAEELAAAVRGRVHITAGRELRTTASFGVAAIAPGTSASGVLLRADEAMYRAKTGGRNAIALAATPPGRAA